MLTQEDYKWLYKIHGGKEKFERLHKFNLELHSKEDVEVKYRVTLALFRDHDIKKASRIASEAKNKTLTDDLKTEILAFSQECIV